MVQFLVFDLITGRYYTLKNVSTGLRSSLVTAQFLPGTLDANLCKNKQKQTNRTHTMCLCFVLLVCYIVS